MQRSIARQLLGFALTTCLLAAGCRREEAVVVYVSADEAIARPVLAAFTQKTGIAVTPLFDTEATKTTGLAQRLRAEANRSHADLFWSSEIAQTVALADDGILAPAHSEALDAWPAQHRDAEGRWYAFAARARVIVYSTERVPAERAPHMWVELANDRWKGRVALADPRFGTTRTHMGALLVAWNAMAMPGYLDAWIEGLGENHARVVTSGNSGVVEAIVAGEADVGMTDTDDVWAAQKNGAKIDLVYARTAIEPDRPGGGTLLIPNTAALVTGGKHREGAVKLLEFLISPEAERLLMESTSRNIPLGPSLQAEAATLLPPDPLRVDWARASAATDEAVKLALRLVAPESHQ